MSVLRSNTVAFRGVWGHVPPPRKNFDLSDCILDLFDQKFESMRKFVITLQLVCIIIIFFGGGVVLGDIPGLPPPS